MSYLDYLGIKISESYGMAETSGASFVNTLDKHKVPIIDHSYAISLLYVFCFTDWHVRSSVARNESQDFG